jgi:hypothetical protein
MPDDVRDEQAEPQLGGPEAQSDLEMQFDDEEGPAAAAWRQLPPERDFFATPYDPPVKALVQEIRDKDLDVKPSFQRHRVWDDVRKSKLIESILLNIPIPTLFFAEDDDKSKVVVDGQQRLTAIKEFYDNRYPLIGLEVLSLLNNKRFDDLTERQQKIIKNRTLRCLVISARSDSEIRFQVFERLNTGGMPLNAQEVRNCVYRGPLNDLLQHLATSRLLQRLLGLSEPHPRMNDCELLLRFFAVREALPGYEPPMKTLLNEYMRRHRNEDSAGRAVLTEVFERAIAPVIALFDDLPFRRFYRRADGREASDKSINRAVFDAQMLVTEGLDARWATEHRDDVRAAFKSLCLTDAAFGDAVSRATADKLRMEYRLRRWKEELLRLGAELPAIHRLP